MWTDAKGLGEYREPVVIRPMPGDWVRIKKEGASNFDRIAEVPPSPCGTGSASATTRMLLLWPPLLWPPAAERLWCGRLQVIDTDWHPGIAKVDMNGVVSVGLGPGWCTGLRSHSNHQHADATRGGAHRSSLTRTVTSRRWRSR